jgi:hypothetical protein
MCLSELPEFKFESTFVYIRPTGPRTQQSDWAVGNSLKMKIFHREAFLKSSEGNGRPETPTRNEREFEQANHRPRVVPIVPFSGAVGRAHSNSLRLLEPID